LNAANIDTPDERVFFGGLQEADGYASMDAMLALDPRPDAVFCVDDQVAIGAIRRIKEAGLHIPGDVALVGFSNSKIAGVVDPPLTTVDQPSIEMGKRAAEILIALMECNTSQSQATTVTLDTTLIIRGSA
jgi:DNA-binding LacI/PurR family transcriptional regulator